VPAGPARLNATIPHFRKYAKAADEWHRLSNERTAEIGIWAKIIVIVRGNGFGQMI
jgi:hypothetical protein